MNIYVLQALIEFDRGEFHAHQCERYPKRFIAHQKLMKAKDWLEENKYIELLGEEYFLTVKGDDAIMQAVKAANQEE